MGILESTLDKAKLLAAQNPVFSAVAKQTLFRSYRMVRTLPQKPITVRMDITNKCNIRCQMCGTHLLPQSYGMKRNWMPVELFRKIAKQTFPYASDVALSCAFEPTMHSDFLEILRIAGSTGCKSISFVTNGILMGEEVCRTILTSGVTHMTVSLDGWSKGVFEEVRQGSDRDRIFENFETLVRLRDELNPGFHILLNFTMMRNNIHELPDIARYALEKKVDRFGAFHVIPRSPENDLYLGNHPGLYDPIYHQVKEMLETSELEDWFLHGHTWEEQNVRTSLDQFGGKFAHCKAPQSILFVDAFGKVFACSQRLREPFGDFAQEDFFEIWDKQPFLSLRRDLDHGILKDECKTCSILAYSEDTFGREAES